MLAERDDYLHAGVAATYVDFKPAGLLAFKIIGLFHTEANIIKRFTQEMKILSLFNAHVMLFEIHKKIKIKEYPIHTSLWV